jgi:glutathione synthase/RimK-type ligase-like ATP-grasp enzyme
MPKEIYLLVGDNDFYGQARKPWISVDTALLIKNLNMHGFTVHKRAYHELVNKPDLLKDSIVLYSFSQNHNLRAYLKDLIWHLRENGNLIIPDWEFLLCHENKGFQEILKRKKGIDRPKGMYIANLTALKSYKIQYPIVLKAIEGSNSTGVSLVHNEEELLKGVKELTPKLRWRIALDLIRRKYVRGDKQYPGWPMEPREQHFEHYSRYVAPQQRFVLQEFVSGLDCDYRVHVFWDKYYVSRRMTKKGDWRASGAKLFRFSKEVPRELLDKAAEVHRLLPSPILAVDLGWKDGVVYLFEFQASHMGLNAVVRNSGYFVEENGNWIYKDYDLGVEENIARAVARYLEEMHPDRLA